MVTKTKLDAWLNGVIEAGWLAAMILAPLFFNVFSSRVFEPDKISLIRSIALVMLIAWLVKLANGGAPWLPAYESDGDGQNQEAADQNLWQRFMSIPLLLPIALMIIAYIISTGFSVARFVSWWGSYQRLQGTYTFFSYLIIALLTMAHLRTPGQLRRLQHTIIVTSLPIAIYGVLQHRGLDPLPWGGDTTTRVAGNAGNAIFLAAYLIMAFFFTLERVYSSFAYLLGYKPEEHGEGQDIPTSIAGGAYLFVLVVQLLTIFWTQSRGPWLGLFFGLYLFVLLLFTVLRPRRHRLWTSLWVGAGVAGAGFLILINTLPIFSGLSNVPYFGRLTTMLDAESGTGRVRVLIWEGASEMVMPHEPLEFPEGGEDSINAIRPLVGYGPETMWIAYNRFYPPELAQYEARNASPDRAHNETWDALVITGLIGFLAYLSLFVSIFYWALRWLGLLVNRRDTILFGILLSVFSIAAVIIFYFYDDGWRFFGVALPSGLMAGLGAYVTLSAFLHQNLQWGRADMPRQLLLITILATITAHFIEIHFGIAIAATRTYFWVQSAMMLVLGMYWAQPAAFTIMQEAEEPSEEEETAAAERGGKRRRRGRGGRGRPARSHGGLEPSVLTATVMIDVLIFATHVFLFTTNNQSQNNPLSILMSSVFQRVEGGTAIFSPYVFFLLLFTWVVAATLGLTVAALQQRRVPGGGWWLRGYLFHALIVWGVWLVYGLIQGTRLVPGIAGNDLNSQLGVVAGHFAMYTWLLLLWLVAAGMVLAWNSLRERRLPLLGQPALSFGVGAVLTVICLVLISNVNIALVRADIIYKQGQQFDAQRNWVSSIELYRRALNARRTEDHYMLFLGRALLEQAKTGDAEGGYTLNEDATLDDVLALTPEAVNQMPRDEILRAAEVVLNEAQRVNPLNTDHTANLARLYRTWSDLTPQDSEERQALLDRSIEYYNKAVTLSPNAAHLWNEKGNAHLANGQNDLAEEAYLHSLSLDDEFSQTYMLLADFYERRERFEESIELLQQGIEKLPNNPQLYSYLGVAYSRSGNPQGAIDANLKVMELQPNNVGAMRNLALLYRDEGNLSEAANWAEQAIARTPQDNTQSLVTLHQLAAQIYQQDNQSDMVLRHYETLRQLDPENPDTLNTLYSLYTSNENWNAAIDTLQALAALQPENYQHPLAIAQILQQVGQPENALTYANQALTLAPEDQKAAINQLINGINGAQDSSGG